MMSEVWVSLVSVCPKASLTKTTCKVKWKGDAFPNEDHILCFYVSQFLKSSTLNGANRLPKFSNPVGSEGRDSLFGFCNTCEEPAEMLSQRFSYLQCLQMKK